MQKVKGKIKWNACGMEFYPKQICFAVSKKDSFYPLLRGFYRKALALKCR